MFHYLVNEYWALNSEINANKNWVKSCHKYKMADGTVTILQRENEEKTSHNMLHTTIVEFRVFLRCIHFCML